MSKINVHFSSLKGQKFNSVFEPGFGFDDIIRVVEEKLGGDGYRLVVSGKEFTKETFNQHKDQIKNLTTIYVCQNLKGGCDLIDIDTHKKTILTDLGDELRRRIVLPELQECMICMRSRFCHKYCCTSLCKRCFCDNFVHSEYKLKCLKCDQNYPLDKCFKTQALILSLNQLEESLLMARNIDFQICTCGSFAINSTMYSQQQCQECQRWFCFFCNRDWDSKPKMENTRFTCKSNCYWETKITYQLVPLTMNKNIEVPNRRVCPRCTQCGAYDNQCKYHTCKCGHQFCFICLESKPECIRKYKSEYNRPCANVKKQDYTIFPRMATHCYISTTRNISSTTDKEQPYTTKKIKREKNKYFAATNVHTRQDQAMKKHVARISSASKQLKQQTRNQSTSHDRIPDSTESNYNKKNQNIVSSSEPIEITRRSMFFVGEEKTRKGIKSTTPPPLSSSSPSRARISQQQMNLEESLNPISRHVQNEKQNISLSYNVSSSIVENKHIDSIKFQAESGLCGLTNFGNTCYMNSALQCLSSIPQLTDHYLNLNDDKKESITAVYSRLMKQMWSEPPFSSVTPIELKLLIGQHVPVFNDYKQKDSQQFMNTLLNMLKDEDDIIDKLFSLFIKSAVTCPHCKTTNERIEPMTFLPLPALSSPYNVKLNDLLQDFFKENILDGDYYCWKCLKMSTVKQKSDLCRQLPPVLIIQLKRFPYNESKEKFDTFIEYPIHNLNLNRYVLTEAKDRHNDSLYNLVAVSNHYGTLSFGHYVTRQKTIPSKATKSYVHFHGAKTELANQNQIVIEQEFSDKDIQIIILFIQYLKCWGFFSTSQKLLEISSSSTFVSPLQIQETLVNVKRRHSRTDKIPKNNTTGLCGLMNIGNTCYMNSALQCLNAIPPFINYFLNLNIINNKNTVSNVYNRLVKQMWSGQSKYAVPRQLKHVVGQQASTFADYQQKDSQEFMNSLLNIIQQKEHKSRQSSVINQLFSINIQSSVMCDQCKLSDSNMETTIFLPLPLPQEDGMDSSLMTLEVLIEDFLKEDLLDGDYYCSRCDTMTKGIQKSDLCLPFPTVLIIQLKRFPFSGSIEKVDTFIQYPIYNLNLNQYLTSKTTTNDCTEGQYNLIAVSSHSGTLQYGHYVTYGKHHQTKEWHLFNDQSIQPVNEKVVLTNNAYVLVYLKSNYQPS
ncbi:unnamed protein product [Didymodactylos carnosus]|uniref:ubiquitinyl hydrolase 1 n=1 Tax=Didymodactylos carnosus TaxID=1234261 RepID=A0A813Y0H6_9BILA|nr:unnamed protein product [Didymodactylos carnosus]CAF3665249.1 unnamed protein product [Didymodactylos carnosus]